MKLIFSIDWVKYYNPDNGYVVLAVSIDKLHTDSSTIKELKRAGIKNKLSLTGTMTREPDMELTYSAQGDLTHHPKYGDQLEALLIEEYHDKSRKGVEAYLASDHFKGIGVKTAQKIYDAFGEDSVEILRLHPEELDKIKLSEKVKQGLTTTLNQDSSSKEYQILELCKMGLTVKEAQKVYDVYHDQSIITIKKNPYNLMFRIKGFGFEKADKIALENGVQKTSDLRLEALMFYLHQLKVYQSGDSYVLKDSLYASLQNEMNKHGETLDRDRFNELIKKLIDKDYFYEYKKDDDIVLYDLKHWTAEQHVALHMSDILKQGLTLSVSDTVLESLSQTTGITYSKDQLYALKAALKQPLCVVTGGPGTGKSTLLKAIVLGLEHYGITESEMALVAPTGRAAKKMAEVTLYPAQTIHRFLGFDGRHYAYDQTNPHHGIRVLIVDETSMVDISLMARLLDSVSTDIKLILLGDKDQLPSVNPGDVLNDIINSNEVKVVYLTENHRQDDDSAIIPLAQSIGMGTFDEGLVQNKEDIDYEALETPQVGDKIIEVIQNNLNTYDLIKDIQVLIPMYKGEVGIDRINYRLQKTFNPNFKDYNDHKFHYFVNDKVIQIKNDMERGVMNGDIGIVIEKKETINEECITVRFDSGDVEYTQKDYYDNLSLAYAMTIHKAQGSEFKAVIMPLSFQYYIMLRRKLLYTAITRAKEHLYLLGDLQALAHGAQNEEPKRLSSLSEFIRTYTEMDHVALEDKGDMSMYVEDDDELSPFNF